MRQINVERKALPQDFTPEHERILTRGHERGVISKATDKRGNPAQSVLGFASTLGVGITIFGGMTFVGLHGKHGNGPVRFNIVD